MGLNLRFSQPVSYSITSAFWHGACDILRYSFSRLYRPGTAALLTDIRRIGRAVGTHEFACWCRRPVRRTRFRKLKFWQQYPSRRGDRRPGPHPSGEKGGRARKNWHPTPCSGAHSAFISVETITRNWDSKVCHIQSRFRSIGFHVFGPMKKNLEGKD